MQHYSYNVFLCSFWREISNSNKNGDYKEPVDNLVQRHPFPQHPHQGKSLVKAKSLAALSFFEELAFELEDLDRELRSLFPPIVSFVVVVESPSSNPDSVTDSNFVLPFLFLDEVAFLLAF